jgi:Domain of Unknown Function (DUF1080)
MNTFLKMLSYASLATLLACGGTSTPSEQKTNDSVQTAEVVSTESAALVSLTEQEKKDGWQFLFDGTSTDKWRGAYLDSMPAKGWTVENGELIVLPSTGGESTNGGDIITKEQYSDFELVLEAKLTDTANSGIKYFVVERKPRPKGSAIGLEFQLLDDEKHPDAKQGKNGNRTIASLYDLITAQGKKASPIGEWNVARIVSKGKHVEHWLNGTKVVEYERGSPDFKKLVAGSKYKTYEGFGESEKGHILLQDHGNKVFFRNIKIRVLF